MKPTRKGKVRDIYDLKDGRLLLVTRNRISAFDRVLGYIPFKGKVLNQLSAFWFEQTQHIVDNHMITVAHPNAMVVKKAQAIPLEVVVRGYITGVTDTSIWGSYARGERTIYGIEFPDGLSKNQKLPRPIITPTTKAASEHDRRLTREEIISEGIVSEEIYLQIERAALRLFSYGQGFCALCGLMLVDTKYEFGLINGKLVLIDEIHTPDSSRFWMTDSYAERFGAGLEPDNRDKEILRRWLAAQDYRGEGAAPTLPMDLVSLLSYIYADVFLRITGHTVATGNESINAFLRRFFQKESF